MKGGWLGRCVERLFKPVLDPVRDRLLVLEVEASEADRREAARREDLEARFKELRDAFLLMRAEFEEVRDRRALQLERGLDGLQSAFEELQRDVIFLRDERLPQIAEFLQKRRLDEADEPTLAICRSALDRLQWDFEALRDEKLRPVEEGLSSLQGALESLQWEIEEIRDRRLLRAEKDLLAAGDSVRSVQAGIEEIRDQRLPSLAKAWEATSCHLYEQVEATRGEVDRIVAGEPLKLTSAVEETSRALPEALQGARSAMAECLRGPRTEILSRAAEVVELLSGHEPVADLGCGRGELLEALQSTGAAAVGVDSDPAMVAACRRHGLDVEEGDIRSWLAARPDASLGAVAAIHVLEHMAAGEWSLLISEAARCLRSGGVLVVECPNPDALRVGAGLFWSDPTHIRPIHPDALTQVMRALGLTVSAPRYRRPFPPDQMLAAGVTHPEVRRVAIRVDEMLSGPRDFILVGEKPAADRSHPSSL